MWGLLLGLDGGGRQVPRVWMRILDEKVEFAPGWQGKLGKGCKSFVNIKKTPRFSTHLFQENNRRCRYHSGYMCGRTGMQRAH